MRHSLRSLLWVLAAFAISTGATNASTTSYSDYASWSASLENITNVTIPDPAPEDFHLFAFGDASVTYSGVTFSTQASLGSGAFFNIGIGHSGYPAVLSSQRQDASSDLANILITFPEPVQGFSLNYGTFYGNDVTFQLSNGETFTRANPADSYMASYFFGVTDTSFTSVQLTSADYVLNVNNIAYVIVPEPSTISLIALGAIGLIGYAWRRRF